MKKYGIVSYNIYCNFTNYGSALQSWALHQTVNRLGTGRWQSVLVDYCPDILKDKDPLNPFENMWDKNEEARRMCQLSMPAICVNYKKFTDFYNNRFDKTKEKYTSANFDEIVKKEDITGFICGSDTIFCMDEFGFDDGFYANYPCMKGNAVSYAASFGDPSLTKENCRKLNGLLTNFKAFGLREDYMIPYVREHTKVPVRRVVDPTLLLTAEDYDKIASPVLEEEEYLLLYSRRYSPEMEEYAERLAHENQWKIIEISLRAINAEKGHRMYYEAGVEEFLSLVKYAEYIVTNSFHGMIFSVQFRRPFVIFSREQCDNKIREKLDLFGLEDHMLVSGTKLLDEEINYDTVHEKIAHAREDSLQFLEMELDNCLR